jgi:Ca2+-binding EF-hand superfamily protein
MAQEYEPWERIQMKTFTKWCNNHLNKRWGKDSQIVDILNDWEAGVPLMKLAVALYEKNDKEPQFAISMPKLRKNEENPKNRIQMVNNGAKAFELLKKANCKLRGVSGENLVDHDKVQILGMVWMLILDYAARGFGGSSAEVKRALLEWVNKNTQNYERVNPPGVKNFTKDWRSGLAWCALIHKHRPDAIDYQACLGKSNAENLETAFAAAEEHFDIPRLLDVEDVDTDSPDEKSVMTYVMEYFLAMAGDGLKDAAAAQAAEWLKFLRDLRNRMNEYERRATALCGWCEETQQGFQKFDFGSSLQEAQAAFGALRNFVGQEKPLKECEKMDLEALFGDIQTQLRVNNLAAYVPPEGLAPDDIESSFWSLGKAQSTHGRKVRENKFRFIEKKEDKTSEETLKQIRESFDHYDENSNGLLNKIEFNAACMEMGIALKTQEDKDNLFNDVGSGGEVTFEQYAKWMESRVKVTMDNAESAKAAFKAIADGRDFITEAQLGTPPLTDEDREYLKANMTGNDGQFDYNAFIDKVMM